MSIMLAAAHIDVQNREWAESTLLALYRSHFNSSQKGKHHRQSS